MYDDSSMIFGDVSRRAATLGLICHRILEGRSVGNDRNELKEFGDDLQELCIKGYGNHNAKHQMLSGVIEGPYVALMIERDYLQKEKSGHGKRLRSMGVDCLEKLACVLYELKEPSEIDLYVPGLIDLIKGWKALAEELSIPEYAKNLNGPIIIGELIIRFPGSVPNYKG
jgi:hypothetical protein